MQYISDISIIFISIILEAFPMLLLGILISSIVEEFVSDEMMARLIPKNRILGALVGVVMGFFIPTCDCAVIPITRRLIKKKVPVNVAITFMLSSPIINPVVIFTTLYSFSTNIPKMTIFRAIVGVIIAIIIGAIMSFTTKEDQVLKDDKNVDDDMSDKDCDSCENCEIHSHSEKNEKVSVFEHIHNILSDCKEEFWDVSKYLIVGSVIASTVQVVLPKTVLYNFTSNKIISTLVLMAFAYVISLCSTSDSFVAKTFVGNFSNNSILAFLLVGPMIDIKNTAMLLGNFKKKFVVKLISLIFICVFIISMVLKI